MAYTKFENFEAARGGNKEYMLLVGRRQPMTIAHQRTIERVIEQGFKPIIVIGSSNGAYKEGGAIDSLFEPISNPMTVEQQKQQLQVTFPDLVVGRDYMIVEMNDLGDNPLWCETLAGKLRGLVEVEGGYPVDVFGKTAMYFIGKTKDRRNFIDKNGNEVLGYWWEETFGELGIPVLVEEKLKGIDINLSATDLRNYDLENLSDEDRELFASPDYMIQLAREVRGQIRQYLKDKGSNFDIDSIPLTAFDLTLYRLGIEKQIMPDQIYEKAKEDAKGGAIDLHALKEAARELNGSMREETVKLKIASASLNQTVYDYATNVRNICDAIDIAVKDGADVLSLEELGLTGYTADDYHQWNKDNDKVWSMLQIVAGYAREKNPDLIISVGAPWHYSDKSKPANDALYNIDNKPFNAQFTIHNGRVQSIACKSILANGPAEYEQRQFTAWPQDVTINTKLPDGTTVPIGKPINVFRDKEGRAFTLYAEQCAEAWPGLQDNAEFNPKEAAQGRRLTETGKFNDITVVLNPSASKPQPSKELNKEFGLRAELVKSGSKHCGVYVYTNGLGSNSGIHAMEATQLYAQGGKVIHHGKRYTHKDVGYSSYVAEVAVAKKYREDAVSEKRRFQNHEVGQVNGGEALFDKVLNNPETSFDGFTIPEVREIEESARNIALWLRDYLAKQTWPAQGFVISLSGGKDSAYGAVSIALMIELEVQENGVEGFFEKFKNLKCKNEVLEIYKTQGEEAATDAIKRNLLTCIYLPSEISGEATRDAARTLVEGDASKGIKGIGGKFMICGVQGIVDESIISISGLDMDKAIQGYRRSHPAKMIKCKLAGLDEEEINSLATVNIKREIKEYVMSPLGSNPKLPKYISDNCANNIPTWAFSEHDVTLQNLQARGRVPVPWAIANMEGKISLTTSNQSEAVLGYSTYAGDSQLGGANPIGGLGKDLITKSLRYFEEHGLIGLSQILSLAKVNKQQPSAELRKQEEGKKAQTDEEDLGISYKEVDEISRGVLEGRLKPSTFFKNMLDDMISNPNSKGLFKHKWNKIDYSNKKFCDDVMNVRDKLTKFANRWKAAQFKRIGSVIAPYTGGNVDPQSEVRTTVHGDHFQTDIAELTLDIMHNVMGERAFRQAFKGTIEDMKLQANLNAEFKKKLQGNDIRALIKDVERLAEAAKADDRASKIIHVARKGIAKANEAELAL